jgi:hypothetical protein
MTSLLRGRLRTAKVVHFFFTILTIIVTAQHGVVQSPHADASNTSRSAIGKPADQSAIPLSHPDANKSDTIKWTDIVAAWCAVAGAVIGGTAAIAAAISARYSLLAVKQADVTEKERANVARAERMSNLWEIFQQIKYLDEELKKSDPKGFADIVLRNINNMGMIGFWWDANLIDRNIAAEEIAESYVIAFEQIRELGELPELGRNGSDLIHENPHAKKLYSIFKDRLPTKTQKLVIDPKNSTPLKQ